MSLHTMPHERIRPGRRRTYTDWLLAVNVLVWRMTGCGLDDLPDTNTRDMYNDGTSPKEAARHIVRNAF